MGDRRGRRAGTRDPRSTLPRLVRLAGLMVLALWTGGAAAQEVEELAPGETLYELRLADGSVLIARVTEVHGDTLVLTTSGGVRLEVTRDQIRDVNAAVGRLVEGEFWSEDPNHTRLYVMNTGRALRRGQAYIGTYAIVFPFVAVGITDRLSVATGAPLLLGAIQPFYVAPKFQLFRTDNAAVSVGALSLFYDEDHAGVVFGTASFGDTDRAFHLGLGWGFAGSDFTSEPVAMLGADVRFSRRGKFITENYLLPIDTHVVVSAGVRFIGDRLTSDLGVGALVGDDGGCCLPLVNFSYAFGRR